MNKQVFKYILGFVLLFLAGLQANAQNNIQAQATLKDYTIKIGDQTKLFLVVKQPIKAKVIFPKLADSISSKIQIVSTGKRDTVIDKANTNFSTVTQSYTITAFDEGSYKIPAYQFTADSVKESSNEVTLQVQTVKVDTTKAIYDIKQPFAVSYTFWDWLRDNWYWVLLGFMVIAIAVAITWYIKNRPEVIAVVEEVKPVIPPHALALTRLQEIKERKLWQQEQIKLYHSEISDTVREYLEKRYGVSTYEKTTDEILTALKHVDITAEKLDRLRQILTMADLAKFAKEKPSPMENEQSMDNAVTFVKTTQPAAEPVKTTDGGGANGLS